VSIAHGVDSRAYNAAWAPLTSDVARGVSPSAILAIVTPDATIRAEAIAGRDSDFVVSTTSIFLTAIPRSNGMVSESRL